MFPSFMLYYVVYYYYYYFSFMLDYDTDCCIPKNVQEFIVSMCEQTGLLF